MRKLHKKMILELVKTLSEANVEIKTMFENKDIQALVVLLDDCNTFAAQISAFIEQLESKDIKTFYHLEEYYRRINQFKNGLCNQDENADIMEEIQKQISVIEKSAEDDLKIDKFEILFIPYKSSMFDCMESVWLSAKDDPQCDAYVVPIPYFEKKPDGSLGKICYEVSQYPDYVPVTDWQQYNIEERCPDVIITHNIYDNNAFATSIHPDFYTERLKKFTDMLVYIPYFVSFDDIPSDYFVAVDGALRCDKVVVSSEKIRQSCINAFNKNEYGDKYGDAHSKYIALGSPKYDKVISTKREDCQLPLEWARLTEGKKVILYNTTISVLINNDVNKWLEKLRYVIDSFRERDDVVLWWRPHPLLETHMRYPLVEEYRKIVEYYVNEGFGIYDDTPDLHRAIVWSDAYYGDGGSLLKLYEVTGKPIMIQNIDILKPEKSDIELRKIWFYDYVQIGEEIWFSAGNFNGLFKADIKTGKARLIGRFPNEERFGWHLYSSVKQYKDRLIFTPCFANEIAVYDMTAKEFTKYKLKEIQTEHDINFKFFNAVMFENFVYFIAWHYPAIVRFDAETGEIEYITDCFKDDFFLEKRAGIFTTMGFARGSIQYLPSRQHNALFKLDMENCRGEFITAGSSEYKHVSMCSNGDEVWLISLKNNEKILSKLNLYTNEFTEYSIPQITNRAKDIFITGDILWVNAENGLGLLAIDKETLSVKSYGIDDNNADSQYRNQEFWFCKEQNNAHTMLSRGSNRIYEVLSSGEFSVISEVIHYADDVNELDFIDIFYVNREKDSFDMKISSDFFLYEKREICFASIIKSQVNKMSIANLQNNHYSDDIKNAGAVGNSIYSNLKCEILG